MPRSRTLEPRVENSPANTTRSLKQSPNSLSEGVTKTGGLGRAGLADLSSLANRAPSVGRLAKMQRMVNESYETQRKGRGQNDGAATASLMTTQRRALSGFEPVVQRSVWSVWGKWHATGAPAPFNTREEAEAWDAEHNPVEEVLAEEVSEDEAETVYVWDIRPSAKNHYNDGWGALYHIQSDVALREAICGPDGTVDAGDQEIYLGQHSKVKDSVKGCNILYSNTWEGSTCTTRVWHCGPTAGAG